MIEPLSKLRDEIIAALEQAPDAAALEEVRVKYLSRNGLLPKLLEGLKDVPKEDKPAVGKLANEVKNAVASSFDAKKAFLDRPQVNYDAFDVTLPGTEYRHGSEHPITATIREISRIFQGIGFSLAEGPDIETEFYNFDALNTPADHPARNEQDTFYIAGQIADDKLGRHLLRTQTSPVQIRVMQNTQPPVRIIAPGSCFRRDNPDATHALMFHQIEGLYVDENVSVADLKGTMEYFFRKLLGEETRVRFRPHFFPFTEPSFEIDFSIPGRKIRGKEWLEIAGCGMVHPNVFQSAGYDSEKYTGFAFGMGVERIAMMLYGIEDIRWFTENDVRFLSSVGAK
ncbi:phenylalanine--tRNA ligase subunit alpha [Kamptonema cortianum]|nr:phenylalanine--tRNA ligase subunit alpha [Oscillatoria laete-virens]MDK3156444.1 phenylalanine--tRNA ligase subunit alpha [Kamptonema cortianum]MDL5046303.1 phenylalanine--tRNA ligase subunit alpha [Oscillatoria amoena NRMC-F 0135]MDL5053875.1 phenylalanine--tRNA ligase subunit alpha [Oscillatoria laete-virens NRMC-F 0139]